MAFEGMNKPLRVTDSEREVRLGLTASSLDQFEERVRLKMDINSELTIKVALECDGTEIDDEDYFATLEPHTCLMVLVQEQRWTPYKSSFVLGLAVENEDGENGDNTEELIWRLQQDLSFFPWLTLEELERLAKMDRDSMRDIVPDPNFLEFLQTLCERYLQEKDAKAEGITVNGINGSAQTNNGTKCSTASILNDPIKLIRLYSKFTNMKAQNQYFSFSSCGSEESLASLGTRGNGGGAGQMKLIMGAENKQPPQKPMTPRRVPNPGSVNKVIN